MDGKVFLEEVVPGSRPHTSYTLWSQGQHKVVGHSCGLPANCIF